MPRSSSASLASESARLHMLLTWRAAHYTRIGVQGQQARTRGSPFAIVNGATAQDVLCVYVPDGVHLDKPIHIVYIPSGKATLLSGS